MRKNLQIKVGISDMDFGYTTKSEGYPTSMSDITELYAIFHKGLIKDNYLYCLIHNDY